MKTEILDSPDSFAQQFLFLQDLQSERFVKLNMKVEETLKENQGSLALALEKS